MSLRGTYGKRRGQKLQVKAKCQFVSVLLFTTWISGTMGTRLSMIDSTHDIQSPLHILKYLGFIPNMCKTKTDKAACLAWNWVFSFGHW